MKLLESVFKGMGVHSFHCFSLRAGVGPCDDMESQTEGSQVYVDRGTTC